ncbi:helix-turn-helix domain-containing protein [Haloarcula marina]|uniref:helix-turn-helix domain-containing protein n=1 Tax=Haloarcula marina TaxID=2961574 RepID=UPI0020B6408E|nr:helix-turn-helix domain-containing protein [Halomicroarcula marina]
MSTILKASVPAEQFALAATFEAVPAVEFDVVRLVPRGPERVIPLLWATNADTESVHAAMADDPSATDVRLVSERTDTSLFQMHWTERIRFVTDVLSAENGVILSARGTSSEWTFRLLFPERQSVSATYEACDECDIDIRQIRPLDTDPSVDRVRLTDEQVATVRTAVDNGYYAVPQETKLQDLASELGVSHQAVSERLRRGHRALVETVVER